MHCNTPSFSLPLTRHPGVASLAMSASGPFSKEKVLSFYTRNINWVYLSLCLISIYSCTFIFTLVDAMKRHFILFIQTRMDSIMALSWPLLRRKLYSAQYKICSKSGIRIFRNWKKSILLMIPMYMMIWKSKGNLEIPIMARWKQISVGVIVSHAVIRNEIVL